MRKFIKKLLDNPIPLIFIAGSVYLTDLIYHTSTDEPLIPLYASYGIYIFCFLLIGLKAFNVSKLFSEKQDKQEKKDSLKKEVE